MDQDRQNANPEEVAGGYGTPTVEQETGGGGDDKQVAQPREEEAFDAAGLSQDSPDGESSEPEGDATGLPEELSPKDDEDSGERFDAG